MNKPTTLIISDEYREAVTWLRGCTLYTALQSIPRSYKKQFRELGELWFPEHTSESDMKAMAFIYSAPDIKYETQSYLWKLKNTEHPMYIYLDDSFPVDNSRVPKIIFDSYRDVSRLTTTPYMEKALESINLSLDDVVRELP